MVASQGGLGSTQSFKVKIFWKVRATELCTTMKMNRASRRPVFDRRLGHVGFMVEIVALGQIFSEYFSFPYLCSFHQLLDIHWGPYHPKWGKKKEKSRR
jgi:hypothetical protein